MLCASNDFLCKQEHWLLPNELHIFSTRPIHSQFVDSGLPVLNISNVLLVGRPYDGTAILTLALIVTFVLRGEVKLPSASRLARNKIPTAIPMFRGQTFQ